VFCIFRFFEAKRAPGGSFLSIKSSSISLKCVCSANYFRFNTTVYTAINEYWKDQLVKDATTKSTLKLFNFEEFEIGKIHNIWKSCGSDLYAVKRACVKSKIVC
jgi:hypothetical protein